MDSIVHFIFGIFYWFLRLLKRSSQQLQERREAPPSFFDATDDLSQYELFQLAHKQLDTIAEELSASLEKEVISVFGHDKDCTLLWGLDIGVCAEITFENYCGWGNRVFIKTNLSDKEKKVFELFRHSFLNEKYESLVIFTPMD